MSQQLCAGETLQPGGMCEGQPTGKGDCTWAEDQLVAVGPLEEGRLEETVESLDGLQAILWLDADTFGFTFTRSVYWISGFHLLMNLETSLPTRKMWCTPWAITCRVQGTWSYEDEGGTAAVDNPRMGRVVAIPSIYPPLVFWGDQFLDLHPGYIMYVCIYIDVVLYTYVYVYVYVYPYPCRHKHVDEQLYVYVCLYVLYVFICIYVFVMYLYIVPMSVHICICTCKRVDMRKTHWRWTFAIDWLYRALFFQVRYVSPSIESSWCLGMADKQLKAISSQQGLTADNTSLI